MPAGQTNYPQFGPVVLVDTSGNAVSPAGVGSGATSTAASPEYAKQVGSSNTNTGQVAVTTAATQVVPAHAGRSKVTLSSTTAVVYYVGGSGVTTTNGLYVAAAAGATVTLDTSAAVYAVGAANVTLSFIEFY